MLTREWVHAVTTRIQVELAPLAWSVIDHVPRVVETAAWKIPSPRTPAEALVLRSLLSEAVAHLGRQLHRRAHAITDDPACTFVPSAFIDRVLTHSSEDPRVALADWARAFTAAFQEHHPPRAAERAARLLREQYQRRWSARTLARAVAIGQAALVRDFDAQFGMPIHAYLRIVRVVAALEELRSHNTEAVALDVGYRSPKNLYRALAAVARVTPGEFRHLESAEASRLINRVKARVTIYRLRGSAFSVNGCV